MLSGNKTCYLGSVADAALYHLRLVKNYTPPEDLCEWGKPFLISFDMA